MESTRFLDPYIIYLINMHPQKSQLIFQLQKKTLKRNSVESRQPQSTDIQNSYSQRYKFTKQNIQSEKDPFCRLILKTVINKIEAGELKPKFLGLYNMYNCQFNQNNYFWVFLAIKLSKLVKKFKYSKNEIIAIILGITATQVECILYYYNYQVQRVCQQKFQFLVRNRVKLRQVFSFTLTYMLNLIISNKQIDIKSLQHFNNKAKSKMQLFSTQTWLFFLQKECLQKSSQQIENGRISNLVEKYNVELYVKLQTLMNKPQTYINMTLNRKEQNFLRKIYFIKFPDKKLQIIQYDQYNWKYNFLGENIIDGDQVIQNQCKLVGQNLDISQIKDNEKHNKQNMSTKFQQKQQSECKTFRKHAQSIQSQTFNHFLKSGICEQECMGKSQIMPQVSCYTKTNLFQKSISTGKINTSKLFVEKQNDRLFLMYLMQQTNSFDENICRNRVYKSKEQIIKILRAKRNTNILKAQFPKRLNKLLLKMTKNLKQNPCDDSDINSLILKIAILKQIIKVLSQSQQQSSKQKNNTDKVIQQKGKFQFQGKIEQSKCKEEKEQQKQITIKDTPSRIIQNGNHIQKLPIDQTILNIRQNQSATEHKRQIKRKHICQNLQRNKNNSSFRSELLPQHDNNEKQRMDKIEGEQKVQKINLQEIQEQRQYSFAGVIPQLTRIRQQKQQIQMVQQKDQGYFKQDHFLTMQEEQQDSESIWEQFNPNRNFDSFDNLNPNYSNKEQLSPKNKLKILQSKINTNYQQSTYKNRKMVGKNLYMNNIKIVNRVVAQPPLIKQEQTQLLKQKLHPSSILQNKQLLQEDYYKNQTKFGTNLRQNQLWQRSQFQLIQLQQKKYLCKTQKLKMKNLTYEVPQYKKHIQQIYNQKGGKIQMMQQEQQEQEEEWKFKNQRRLNSKQIAQMNILFYLLLIKYDIQQPILQVVLDMTMAQIITYHREHLDQINTIGPQYVQIFTSNPDLFQSKRQPIDYISALLSMHIKDKLQEQQSKCAKEQKDELKKQ